MRNTHYNKRFLDSWTSTCIILNNRKDFTVLKRTPETTDRGDRAKISEGENKLASHYFGDTVYCVLEIAGK